MSNQYDGELIFGLDIQRSANAINAEIPKLIDKLDGLQATVDHIKLSNNAKVELGMSIQKIKDLMIHIDGADTQKALSEIRDAVTGMKNLAVTISDIQLDQSVASGLSRQIQNILDTEVNISGLQFNIGNLEQQSQKIGEQLGNKISQSIKNELNFSDTLEKEVQDIMKSFRIPKARQTDVGKELKSVINAYRKELKNPTQIDLDKFSIGTTHIPSMDDIYRVLANNMKIVDRQKQQSIEQGELIRNYVKTLNTGNHKIYIDEYTKADLGEDYNDLKKRLGAAFTSDVQYKFNGATHLESFFRDIEENYGVAIDRTKDLATQLRQLDNILQDTKGSKYISGEQIIDSGYFQDDEIQNYFSEKMRLLDMAEKREIEIARNTSSIVQQTEKEKQKSYRQTKENQNYFNKDKSSFKENSTNTQAGTSNRPTLSSNVDNNNTDNFVGLSKSYDLTKLGFDNTIFADKSAHDFFKTLLKDEKALIYTTQEIGELGGLKSFTTHIRHATGEVESLRFALEASADDSEDYFFKFQGAFLNDKGALDTISKIEKRIADFTIKKNKLLSSHSGAYIDTSEFDNALSLYRKGEIGVNQLSLAYNKLATAATEAKNSLHGKKNSFDPISNATNTMRDYDSMLKQLRTSIGKLSDPSSILNGVKLDDYIDNFKERFEQLTSQMINGNIPLNKDWTNNYSNLVSEMANAENLAKAQFKVESDTSSIVSDRADHYNKLNKAQKERLQLQRKLVNADGLEKDVLKAQINKRNKRVNYNQNYISSHNLKDNNLDGVVSDVVSSGAEKVNIELAKSVDTISKNLQTLESKWEKQGILVGEFREKVEKLKLELSEIKLGGTLDIPSNIKNIGGMKEILQSLVDRSDSYDLIDTNLKQQASAYKQILVFNEQIDKLDRTKDSAQIKELEYKKREYEQINRLAGEIVSNELSQIKNESELSNIIEKRKTLFSQARNEVYNSIESNAEKERNKQQEKNDSNIGRKINALDLKLDKNQGKYSQKTLDDLINKLKLYGTVSEDTKLKINEMQSAFDDMSDRSLVDNKRLSAEKEYLSLNNQLTQSVRGIATEQQRLNLANSIESFIQKNTRITKDARIELSKYIDDLRDMDSVMTTVKKNDISTSFKKIENSMRGLNKLGYALKDQLSQAASSFTQWFSVSSAIMAGVYQLQNMPRITKQLDDAITDFSMATDLSDNKTNQLIQTYGKLGSILKANVTDVTVSATEWLKQGKSIEEAEFLIKNSMVLSKVGKLSSADATKYLTSAMKGYRVAAEDTLNVVDKLSAVDMASATDVGGLAEAMSGVAASADLAGVSMDRLLGYAAVIGETTQEGMSQVGTALNAVFARMGNIKLARLKDYQNNGDDLSNVETVLRGVGISLRDTNEEFKQFDTVLDETAGKWNTFSSVQQRAVAQAFAGTHHYNDFIILMQNYSTALKYAEISANSSGEAMKKFSKYQESLSGHLEELRNEFTLTSSKIASSGLLEFLTDLGTVGLKSVNGLLDSFGSFGTLATIGTGILSAKGHGLVNFDEDGKVANTIFDTIKGLNQVKISDDILNWFNTLSDVDVSKGSASLIELSKSAGIADKQLEKFLATWDGTGNISEQYTQYMKKAGTATSQFSTAIKSVAVNMGIMFAATLAINAVIYILDEIFVSFEEQQEVVDNLTEKISDLRSEYDLLKSDPSADSERLNYLKRQIKLEEDLLAIEKEKLALKDIEENMPKISSEKTGTSGGTVNPTFTTDDVVETNIQNDLKNLQTARENIDNILETGKQKHLLDDYSEKETKALQQLSEHAETLKEQYVEIADAKNRLQQYLDDGTLKGFQAEKAKEQVQEYQKELDRLDPIMLKADLALGNAHFTEGYDAALGKLQETSYVQDNLHIAGLSGKEMSGYINGLEQVNEKLREGKISSDEWFNSISSLVTNSGLESAMNSVQNWSTSTTDELEFAVANTTTQLANGLADVTNKFLSGNMSVNDYIDSLQAGSEAQMKMLKSLHKLEIGQDNLAVVSDDATEANIEAAESYNELYESVQDLEDVEGLATVLSDDIDFFKDYESWTSDMVNTDEFQNHINVLSDELATFLQDKPEMIDSFASTLEEITGQSIDRSLLQSQNASDIIAGLASNNVSATQAMVAWTMQAIGSDVKNASQAIDGVLTALGDVIAGFKYTIKAKPYIAGKIGGNLLEVAKDGSYRLNALPEFGIDFTGSGGDSVNKLSAALKDAGGYFTTTGDVQAKLNDINTYGNKTPNSNAQESNGSNKAGGNGKSGGKSKSSGGGGKGSGGSQKEPYKAEIDKYKNLKDAVEEYEDQLDNLNDVYEHTEDTKERIKLKEVEIQLYHGEKNALDELNKARDKEISQNVERLRSLKFDIEYDPTTDNLKIKNMEHLNELSQDQIKDIEELIKSTEALNKENKDAAKQWRELTYAIVDANKEITELMLKQHEETVRDKEHLLDLFANRKDKLGADLKIYDSLMNDVLLMWKKLLDRGYKLNKKDIQELEKDWMDYYDKRLEREKELLEKQLDDHDSALDGVLYVIDKELEGLDKQIDALNKINEERKVSLDLQKAQAALDKARNQKTRMVLRKDKGWIYEADEDAIKQAEEDLADKQHEAQISKLEQQKEELEELKNKWEEIPDLFERYQNELLMKELLGANAEEDILNGRIDVYDKFKDSYIGIQEKIKANTDELEEHTNEAYLNIVKAFENIALLSERMGTKQQSSWYVNKNGQAPNQAQIGDIIYTNGGTYKITGKDENGKFISQKLDDLNSHIQDGMWGKEAYTSDIGLQTTYNKEKLSNKEIVEVNEKQIEQLKKNILQSIVLQDVFKINSETTEKDIEAIMENIDSTSDLSYYTDDNSDELKKNTIALYDLIKAWANMQLQPQELKEVPIDNPFADIDVSSLTPDEKNYMNQLQDAYNIGVSNGSIPDKLLEFISDFKAGNTQEYIEIGKEAYKAGTTPYEYKSTVHTSSNKHASNKLLASYKQQREWADKYGGSKEYKDRLDSAIAREEYGSGHTITTSSNGYTNYHEIRPTNAKEEKMSADQIKSQNANKKSTDKNTDKLGSASDKVTDAADHMVSGVSDAVSNISVDVNVKGSGYSGGSGRGGGGGGDNGDKSVTYNHGKVTITQTTHKDGSTTTNVSNSSTGQSIGTVHNKPSKKSVPSPSAFSLNSSDRMLDYDSFDDPYALPEDIDVLSTSIKDATVATSRFRDDMMTVADQKWVKQLQQTWNDANKAGNKELMKKVSETADAIRNQYISGMKLSDGTDYSPIGIDGLSKVYDEFSRSFAYGGANAAGIKGTTKSIYGLDATNGADVLKAIDRGLLTKDEAMNLVQLSGGKYTDDGRKKHISTDGTDYTDWDAKQIGDKHETASGDGYWTKTVYTDPETGRQITLTDYTSYAEEEAQKKFQQMKEDYKNQNKNDSLRPSSSLSDSDKQAIKDAQKAYNDAKAKGDTAGMNKAHADAEAIRNKHGYSGGDDGSKELSKSNKNLGNSVNSNRKSVDNNSDALSNNSDASTDAAKTIKDAGDKVSSALKSAKFNSYSKSSSRGGHKKPTKVSGFNFAQVADQKAKGGINLPAGLYNVDELGSEFIINPVNDPAKGRLVTLDAGASVIPAHVSKTLWKFGQNPEMFINNHNLMSKNQPIYSGGNQTITNHYTVEDITLPNVHNGEEFWHSLIQNMPNEAQQWAYSR